MAKQRPIRITYPLAGKHGKHGKKEYREFGSIEEAMAYLDRNEKNNPAMRGIREMLAKAAGKGE